MVFITTSDGQEFHVDNDVIERSATVRNFVLQVEDDKQAIPLPNVTGDVFKKVLEYCEHHRGEPLPVDSSDDEDEGRRQKIEISEWDQKYICTDQEMIFEVILAAHCLDIKPLVRLGCKTVADMMKGKTSEEIRKQFNIVNEFTPEEEAQIKKENEWAEDH